MKGTRLLWALGFSLSLGASTFSAGPQAPADDGRREFTVSGCLLRHGYASYRIEDAKVEAIEGKPVGVMSPDSPIARVKTWSLEGGGNLGPRAGETVQIVGRSDWKESDVSEEPAVKPPVLEVKSVKTVTASCS